MVWLSLLLLLQVAHAEPIQINGRVVSVADGDTVTILGAVDIQASHTNAATKAMKEAKRWDSFS